ncbi:MAG: formylglycine-generating enzyme family protein, partial [Nannocystaceae bacterium]
DERPRHQVRLTQGYWMGETPVTQALWTEVMGDNPSRFKGDAKRPVEEVTWHACETFCQRLNERIHGLEVELPTEAQWEVACRAGEGVLPRYGELDTIAWYRENSGRETHAVGEKLPNRWGLYDMLGNVWEWCRDDMRSYGKGLHSDPIGSTIDSDSRVIRGGSFHGVAGCCRAGDRIRYHRDTHWSALGFRLCRGQPAADRQEGTRRG